MDLYAIAYMVRNNYTTAEQAEQALAEIRKSRTPKADINFLKAFIVEHLIFWMAQGTNDHF